MRNANMNPSTIKSLSMTEPIPTPKCAAAIKRWPTTTSVRLPKYLTEKIAKNAPHNETIPTICVPYLGLKLFEDPDLSAMC